VKSPGASVSMRVMVPGSPTFVLSLHAAMGRLSVRAKRPIILRDICVLLRSRFVVFRVGTSVFTLGDARIGHMPYSDTLHSA
jgi:hypothetical protein